MKRTKTVEEQLKDCPYYRPEGCQREKGCILDYAGQVFKPCILREGKR